MSLQDSIYHVKSILIRTQYYYLKCTMNNFVFWKNSNNLQLKLSGKTAISKHHSWFALLRVLAQRKLLVNDVQPSVTGSGPRHYMQYVPFSAFCVPLPNTSQSKRAWWDKVLFDMVTTSIGSSNPTRLSETPKPNRNKRDNDDNINDGTRRTVVV